MTAADFTAWRQRVRMTQQEVAAEFAVTPKYVRDLEHGRRRVTRRTELAARYVEIARTPDGRGRA